MSISTGVDLIYPYWHAFVTEHQFIQQIQPVSVECLHLCSKSSVQYSSFITESELENKCSFWILSSTNAGEVLENSEVWNDATFFLLFSAWEGPLGCSRVLRWASRKCPWVLLSLPVPTRGVGGPQQMSEICYRAGAGQGLCGPLAREVRITSYIYIFFLSFQSSPRTYASKKTH